MLEDAARFGQAQRVEFGAVMACDVEQTILPPRSARAAHRRKACQHAVGGLPRSVLWNCASKRTSSVQRWSCLGSPPRASRLRHSAAQNGCPAKPPIAIAIGTNTTDRRPDRCRFRRPRYKPAPEARRSRRKRIARKRSTAPETSRRKGRSACGVFETALRRFSGTRSSRVCDASRAAFGRIRMMVNVIWNGVAWQPRSMAPHCAEDCNCSTAITSGTLYCYPSAIIVAIKIPLKHRSFF
jgi:hypothetical protein